MIPIPYLNPLHMDPDPQLDPDPGGIERKGCKSQHYYTSNWVRMVSFTAKFCHFFVDLNLHIHLALWLDLDPEMEPIPSESK